MARRVPSEGITAEFPIPIYLARSIAEAYVGIATEEELRKLAFKVVRALAETEDDFIELSRMTARIRGKKGKK